MRFSPFNWNLTVALIYTDNGLLFVPSQSESKVVSASPVITVDAMIVSPASTPLPTFHSDSPSSTTCSSVLSPVSSELSSLAEMTTVQSPASQTAVGPASIVDLASDQWLLPWFPTAESRGLILHFCQTSTSLLSTFVSPVSEHFQTVANDASLPSVLSGQPSSSLAPPRDASPPRTERSSRSLQVD